MAFVLASSSPRRRALLAQVGLHVAVRVPAVDETPAPGERPEALVERLARAKAAAVVGAGADGLPALAADTVVVIDGVALGKPADAAAARSMLRRLSGARHDVVTAVALAPADGGPARSVVVTTRVGFRPLSAAEIGAYVDTGESFDKAGGYGIQGLAAVFVDRIEGSYSNVVGLPLAETEALLRAGGIDTWQLRSQHRAADPTLPPTPSPTPSPTGAGR